MKIIIGLGNPGEKYEGTRHNVGFAAIENLAKALKLPEWKEQKKFKALITEGTISTAASTSTAHTKTHSASKHHPTTATETEEKLLLVKPLTFMNLSGESAAALMKFYKLSPADIWVIYDDIDLPLGQLRIRQGGGPGTHNGMKSLVSLLGSQEFPRFRIGIENRQTISNNSTLQQDISSFVLERFNATEKSTLKTVLQKSTSALQTALHQGIETAMNQHNITSAS